MEQSVVPLQTREFVIHQYYSVQPDPVKIDEQYDHIHTDDPECFQALQEDRQRMHRIFQAILANEKALQAVMVYEVVSQYGVDCGSCEDELFRNHYGKEDIEFFDILLRVSGCLAPEDRAWLARYAKAATMEDREDRRITFEGLDNSFKPKASGWDINRVCMSPPEK